MSGEVILICGKICSGKTYLAKRLCDEKNALLLSCDELMLTVFDPNLGDDFDRVSKKCMDYLFKKAACIAKSGINVILDWGFWKRKDRDEAKAFFKEEDIKTTLYYIDVENEQWLKNIQKRNSEVQEGKTTAYYVDENLLIKLESAFEVPFDDEKYVVIKC